MATRSHEIIARLKASDPRIQAGGFPAAMRVLSDSRSLKDAVKGILPDGFRIDPDAREVLLIEVADTHPIRPAKGEKIANLYDELEQMEWVLRVVVLDYAGGVTADVHGWAFGCDAVSRHAPGNCMDATPAAKAAAKFAQRVTELQSAK